jgi:hypothetical protein
VRRVVACVALVAGIALIVTPLALSLFPRAYAGERMADNFRQTMSPEGVAMQQSVLGLVGEVVKEYDSASTSFATKLGISRPAYDRFVAANYPAVATAAKQIGPVAANVVAPVMTQLKKIQPKWDQVTRIPGLGLPIAAAPWMLLLTGVALALLGVAGLFRPTRAVTVAILALGVGMTVAPFALSIPQKTSDTSEVLKVGRVALSRFAITSSHRGALIFDGMVGQLKANMLPDLGRRLRTPLADLDATIARDYPSIATGLREWPGIAANAFALTAAQAASYRDFKKVDGIGYGGMEWIAIGPGIVLLLLAGGALWTDRRALPHVGTEVPA